MKRPVADVDTQHIVNVLTTLWTDRHKLGERLRDRIKSVLDFAKVKGLRKGGENPARWKEHLEHLLPKVERVDKAHRKALPFDQIAVLTGKLAAKKRHAVACLQFTILTAVRSGEARGALWSEIDLVTKVWTIPGIAEEGWQRAPRTLVPASHRTA
jgi:integrase